tara:strand:+ start:293 stop:1303 length:1011 start_codon:yes stop_codon:yes gene_type:complete
MANISLRRWTFSQPKALRGRYRYPDDISNQCQKMPLHVSVASSSLLAVPTRAAGFFYAACFLCLLQGTKNLEQTSGGKCSAIGNRPRDAKRPDMNSNMRKGAFIMRRSMITLTALSVLTMGATPALAAGQQKDNPQVPDETQQSMQQNSATLNESESVHLSGSVKEITGDQFTMNYGDGEIAVDMSDYDWFDEGFVQKGDQVRVNGEVSEGFFTDKQVVATSIFLPERGAYYTNGEDRTGFVNSNGLATGEEWVTLTGEVTEVREDEIALSTGHTTITVDSSEVPENSADGQAHQKIQTGDRISVAGEMDAAGLFTERELVASSIIVMNDSNTYMQ